MQTISELNAKATELRKIADKLDAAAQALADLGGSSASAQPNGKSSVDSDLSQLSGMDAIEEVMRNLGEPTKKDRLAFHLKMRGKAIGDGTLESYLSRGKKEHRFWSYGRGLWGLPKSVSPPPTDLGQPRIIRRRQRPQPQST